MKALRITAAVLIALVVLGVGVLYAWHFGWLVTDRSADVRGAYIQWNGRRYVLCSVTAYDEGRVIARSQDGHYRIRELKEDPSHTFIVSRLGLGTDDGCYVAEDYAIPTEGTVTTVSWDDTYIDDPAFIAAVDDILAAKEPSFVHETDGIYRLSDGQHMRKLDVGYEDCPIAAQPKGYMGQIDGQWVITVLDIVGSNNLLEMYLIPSEYIPIIEPYLD